MLQLNQLYLLMWDTAAANGFQGTAPSSESQPIPGHTWAAAQYDLAEPAAQPLSAAGAAGAV